MPAGPHAVDGTREGGSKDKEHEAQGVVDELPGSHPSRRTPSWSTRLSTSLGLGLNETLEHDASTVPLAWMALLTGLVDGAVYSRAEIWTGFQTGNTVQVALGITTYIFPLTSTAIPRAPLLLLLRSLSLLAFFLAGIVGSRVGEAWGHRRRAYLVASSVVQSALLFGAAGILWTRPEGEELTYRYWPGVILLIAFSMVSPARTSRKARRRSGALWEHPCCASGADHPRSDLLYLPNAPLPSPSPSPSPTTSTSIGSPIHPSAKSRLARLLHLGGIHSHDDTDRRRPKAILPKHRRALSFESLPAESLLLFPFPFPRESRRGHGQERA